MKVPTIAAVLGLAAVCSAEVFLHETFSDGQSWTDRWTPSTYREDLGKMEVSPGKWFVDEAKNAGLRTTEDYRFYAVSTKFKPFNNKGKDLVIQLDVKNEQNIDCGGSYVKVFSDKFDAKTFNGDSDYNIMFGPDICGTKAIVHAIFNYNGTNHNLKKTIVAPNDVYTHTYTLIVKPDQTYQVLVDGEEKAAGSMLEDWDFLPPKKINDPEASKPEDWVDEAEIDDPEDVKPEGYDDVPEYIADPEASKPEDWDDDMDGEWEAPSIVNPDYKGPWKAKKIPNPAYKGPWVHPEIDNPDYKVDNEIYAYDFNNIGLDLWQVKSGTIFDNLLITDDVKEAEKIREESLELAKKEKDAKTAHDEATTKKEEEEKAEKADDEPKTAAAEEKVEIDLNLDDEIPSAKETEDRPAKDEL
ncbi:Calreticulin family-domain-containing protein [Radiomyces spectabilis]|uniref:Calreticulin family-domain-containing protein n=1 Tax=Radiomyces spectabilis TaxID=64574 RepID=UPI0022203AC1|nr:Calreticulin family-domain-containing protein [Radiomyces spectabilis]KAI8384982.1 Calreticulin family-domain-containing protein [Radiomyces spectabilis]